MPYQPPIPASYTTMDGDEIADRIRAHKKRFGRRLVILGHHYQQDDVIQFADSTGDSLKLSQIAAEQEGVDLARRKPPVDAHRAHHGVQQQDCDQDDPEAFHHRSARRMNRCCQNTGRSFSRMSTTANMPITTLTTPLHVKKARFTRE